MTNYTCEHCNNAFKTISLLTRHQKRAAYCLQIQGKEIKSYNCECGKEYSSKSTLQRHITKCDKVKLDDITTIIKSDREELLLKVIDKYGDMVKDLQTQIAELATMRTDQSGGNNRNVVMNSLQPITDEDLKEHLNHLTLKFIQEGAKGYADFAGYYPFKDKVLCTDKARKKIRYKNEDGQITDDGRALAQRFFLAISERNADILNKAYRDLHHEIEEIVADNRAGEVDVAGILTKATTLQDILIKSQNAARGEDDEFAQEFLSHLSKIL